MCRCAISLTDVLGPTSDQLHPWLHLGLCEYVVNPFEPAIEDDPVAVLLEVIEELFWSLKTLLTACLSEQRLLVERETRHQLP